MRFPVELRFPLFSLFGNTIRVFDATGTLALFAKQRLFALKEQVTLFHDEAQTVPLYALRADRVIDFNARYALSHADGTAIGTVARDGLRSLWRTRYTVRAADGRAAYLIREERVAARFLDALVSGIPILGALSGYVFNPAYAMTRADGTVIMRLVKRPALLESRFAVESLAASPSEQELGLLAFTMITLLERTKG